MPARRVKPRSTPNLDGVPYGRSDALPGPKCGQRAGRMGRSELKVFLFRQPRHSDRLCL